MIRIGGLNSWTVVVLQGLLLPFVLNGQDFVFENFEQGSVFGSSGLFDRSDLSDSPTAPFENPELHINRGGDLEYRFSAEHRGSVLSLAGGIYGDVRIDGYVGIGSAGNAGGINGGLVLRSSGPGGYYLAYIVSNPGPIRDGNFYIAERVGGLTQSRAGLAIPDFDPKNENYHVTFEAKGDLLSASLSRERIVNGALEEILVGQISARDDTLQSGRAGVYGFTSFENEIFFDDLTLSPVPESRTVVLMGLGIALACLMRNRALP